MTNKNKKESRERDSTKKVNKFWEREDLDDSMNDADSYSDKANFVTNPVPTLVPENYSPNQPLHKRFQPQKSLTSTQSNTDRLPAIKFRISRACSANLLEPDPHIQ